jgi:hypothetical protein
MVVAAAEEPPGNSYSSIVVDSGDSQLYFVLPFVERSPSPPGPARY